MNKFEEYPELSEMMQEYATFGSFRSWQKFTDALNNALIKAEKLPTHDVMAMLPTESQLDEIAFKKYGNDPEGAIKLNLIKRMAFVEGCEFMLRLLKDN